MKAVAIIRSLPANHPERFVTLDLPKPEPGPRDLLVCVKAVAVNPVDYKVRQGRDPERTEEGHWQRLSEAIAPQGSICSIVEMGSRSFPLRLVGDFRVPG